MKPDALHLGENIPAGGTLRVSAKNRAAQPRN
jgi:hypothetical protein